MERVQPVVKYSDCLPWAVQMWLNRSRWAQGSMYYVRCTLAQHGEYHWTVHVHQRCSLLPNYFDHLLSYLFTPRLALSSVAKIFPATIPSCSTDCKLVILVSLTRTYWVVTDDSPTCQSCGIPLTVKHMLVECANLRDIRKKYFTASSLADIFNRVDNHTVIDFIKETHFYHQL